MKDWHSNKEVEKGDIGEEIIIKYLEKKGYIVYKPITDGPHRFDNMVYKETQKSRIVEVKTYARRNIYPDTGIDLPHYHVYKKYSEDIYIFFVDELEGSVYGNKLSILETPTIINNKKYPLKIITAFGDKIFFPLCLMEKYFELPEKLINAIRKKQTRNDKYSYSSANKFKIEWLENKSWI